MKATESQAFPLGFDLKYLQPGGILCENKLCAALRKPRPQGAKFERPKGTLLLTFLETALRVFLDMGTGQIVFWLVSF